MIRYVLPIIAGGALGVAVVAVAAVALSEFVDLSLWDGGTPVYNADGQYLGLR